MTDDQIRTALVNWLVSITGHVVIIDRQSGPRPVQPYIMVNLTGTVAIRSHEQQVIFTPSREDEPLPEEDTAGDPIYPPITATPLMDVEWRFSIFAFGTDCPSDLLRPIRSAAKLLQVMEPIYPGVVLHELSQIRSVPEWVNTAWEERAQMDLFLHGVTRDGFVVDVIDDIEPVIVELQGT